MIGTGRMPVLLLLKGFLVRFGTWPNSSTVPMFLYRGAIEMGYLKKIRLSGVIHALIFVILVGGQVWASDGRIGRLPDEHEIAGRIQPLIDDGSYVGIVIGIVGPHGRKVYAFGRTDLKGNEKPTAQTIFPLASITKTFTGVLLADLTLRGVVRLDDPITKFLPSGLIKPNNPLNSVTLLDLATHTSGFPKMPNNARSNRFDKMRKPYSVRQLYEFLSNFRSSHPPGAEFRYSNIGIALLGHILERVTGMPYEKLVHQRICSPLGMRSTRITPTRVMLQRMAQGYGKNMNPVSLKAFDVGKGSGGLYSSTNDMMDYLAANIGLVETGVSPALIEAQKAHRRVPGKENAFMGITWHVRQIGSTQIVSKNGGLAGFQSFLAFSRSHKVGIIAFANSSPNSRSLDAKARKILMEIIFNSSR